MSIKTPKRLVLGVIAALVFAPFAAVVPASAAGDLDVSLSQSINRGDVVGANAVIDVELTGAFASEPDVLRIRVEQTASSAIFPVTAVPATDGSISGGTGNIVYSADAGTFTITKPNANAVTLAATEASAQTTADTATNAQIAAATAAGLAAAAAATASADAVSTAAAADAAAAAASASSDARANAIAAAQTILTAASLDVDAKLITKAGTQSSFDAADLANTTAQGNLTTAQTALTNAVTALAISRASQDVILAQKGGNTNDAAVIAAFAATSADAAAVNTASLDVDTKQASADATLSAKNIAETANDTAQTNLTTAQTNLTNATNALAAAIAAVNTADSGVATTAAAALAAANALVTANAALVTANAALAAANLAKDAADAALAAAIAANVSDPITLGTYVFKVFVDANLNGRFDSGETSEDITVIFAGAPYTSTVTADRSTVPSAGITAVTYTVAVRDVNGNPTFAVGSEEVTLTKSVANAAGTAVTSGTAFDAAATTTAVTHVGMSNTYRAVVTYTHDDDAIGHTFTHRSNLKGAATTFPGASFSVPDQTDTTITKLAMTSKTGLYFGTAGGADWTTTIPAATPATPVTVLADVSVTSITLTLTGTASKTYSVATTLTGVTDATRVTAPATVRTLADGTATFTVANSAPKVSATTGSDAVLVSVTDTTGLLTAAYQINWTPVTAVWTLSPATNFDVLEKSSNTVTATVTDNFARVLSGVAYTVTVAGRNVAVVSGVTDATGKATYTVADTATTSYTTAGSDAVTFANVATTTIPAATKSVTFTYKATLAAVGTVTVSIGAAGPFDIDQVEALAGNPAGASTTTYTATLRTAAGAAVGAGTQVTFAGGADDLFVDGVKTGVTNANGEATVTVYRQKVGFAAITATANGVSGSAASRQWINDVGTVTANGDTGAGSSSARNVALSAAQTIAPGSAATVIATVTDRWGNPVRGHLVTWSTSGVGRAIAGADFTVGTDTNGQAQFQVSSLATETGAMTVRATISGGQTLDLAGRVAGTAVAGVTAGNTSATSTVNFTVPVVVTPEAPGVAPTLTASLDGRVLLFGTCMADEGDIIVYVKSPGKPWKERAKTLECEIGEFEGSLKAPKSTKYYRVKQEGTGLWSSSVLIRP